MPGDAGAPGLDTRHFFIFPLGARPNHLPRDRPRSGDGRNWSDSWFLIWANVFSVMAIQTERSGHSPREHFEIEAGPTRRAARCSLMGLKLVYRNPVNLPNYFLADLPPEAVAVAAMVTEACQTLKRNRAQYLAQRSRQLVGVLCDVAEAWLNRTMPFAGWRLNKRGTRPPARRERHNGKCRAGGGDSDLFFHAPTLEKGLDNFFHQFSAGKFSRAARAGNWGRTPVSVTGDGCHVDKRSGFPASFAAERSFRAEGWSPSPVFWRGPELLVALHGGQSPEPGADEHCARLC